MTFPFQLAIIGATALMTLYYLFNQNNRPMVTNGNNRRSDYSDYSSSRSSYPSGYDTQPTKTRRNSEATQECSICLMDMRPQHQNRMVSCGHVFHKKCIDQWMREARICPICRHYI